MPDIRKARELIEEAKKHADSVHDLNCDVFSVNSCTCPMNCILMNLREALKHLEEGEGGRGK